ncbi:hypothetical protein [Mucilaginibacter rubeus]|uniref:Uncharacterized protein n=1 Tax=Mucilaginibacter rubeus TaxID=2027860 RepID=A0A5C1I667_9SPHI|nr:hypothetical protein [Mucilaginibacter rubeus]QEM13445.1 hypothetical protein DEO27_026695 [Mucilaginibacter rubeus]
MKKVLLISLLLPFAAKAQQKPLTDTEYLNQQHYTYVRVGKDYSYKSIIDTIPVIVCDRNVPRRVYKVLATLYSYTNPNGKPISTEFFLCEDRKTRMATPGQISK